MPVHKKLGWLRVENADGMPKSYKEGSVFITGKSSMSCQEND